VNSQFERKIKEVTDIIVASYNPQQIILFGSHAYGVPNADSDVDLLIILESDERPAKRAAMISRLLHPRPFPMDILVRTPDEIKHRLKIGDPFIQEVLKRGKVLYERRISERVVT